MAFVASVTSRATCTVKREFPLTYSVKIGAWAVRDVTEGIIVNAKAENNTNSCQFHSTSPSSEKEVLLKALSKLRLKASQV